MSKRLRFFSLSLLFFSKFIHAVPETVGEVQLEKYLGLWHEIARIPNRFQDNAPRGYGRCTETTAEYALRADNEITVTNSCTRTKSTGESKRDVALGVARVVEGSRNTRLKVNFTGLAFLRWLGIGSGDYWVLGLGPLDEQGLYSWALVGSPQLDYGWILARKPVLSEAELEEIFSLAERQGYSRERFQR